MNTAFWSEWFSFNSQVYLTGDTNRGSVHLDLNLGGSGLLPVPLLMSVKRLAVG